MKNIFKKILIIGLVATMGTSIAACGSKDSGNSSSADKGTTQAVDNSDVAADNTDNNDTNNNAADADDTKSDSNGNNDNTGNANTKSGNAGNKNTEESSVQLKDLKQDMTVNLVDDNSDPQEGGEAETKVNVVTDKKGEPVTDKKGNTETEIVTENGGSAATENTDPSYTPKYKIANTYWLDMTKAKDIEFNGNFLIAKFKVKDDTPDGNYDITINKLDIANWAAKTVDAKSIGGYVTVGDAKAPEVDSPKDGEFTFSVENTKAKAGDEIEVKFDVSDNPGIVALMLNFRFDSNALDFEGLETGDDADGIIEIAKSNTNTRDAN